MPVRVRAPRLVRRPISARRAIADDAPLEQAPASSGIPAAVGVGVLGALVVVEFLIALVVLS